VLQTLSVVTCGIVISLLFTLQVRCLELEVLVDREERAEVAVQALDLQQGLTMLLSDLRVDMFEFLYPHPLVPVSFL